MKSEQRQAIIRAIKVRKERELHVIPLKQKTVGQRDRVVLYVNGKKHIYENGSLIIISQLAANWFIATLCCIINYSKF